MLVLLCFNLISEDDKHLEKYLIQQNVPPQEDIDFFLKLAKEPEKAREFLKNLPKDEHEEYSRLLGYFMVDASQLTRYKKNQKQYIEQVNNLGKDEFEYLPSSSNISKLDSIRLSKDGKFMLVPRTSIEPSNSNGKLMIYCFVEIFNQLKNKNWAKQFSSGERFRAFDFYGFEWESNSSFLAHSGDTGSLRYVFYKGKWIHSEQIIYKNYIKDNPSEPKHDPSKFFKERIEAQRGRY